MSQIKLKHSGGNGVIIAAPSSNPASDVTFTLPNADGSASQVIKTDASGNLSFGTKGKILKRTSTELTSTFAVTGTTETFATGLDTNFTLSNSSNSVMVVVNLRTQIEAGTDTNARANINLFRDSTAISNKFIGYFHSGGSSKNIYQEVSIFMFDAPADTSQHTYRIKGSADTSGVTFRILEGSDPDRSSYLHCMEFEA
tara:strand:+ start:1231 stop:1827 length:597 start_codon:yes stop_codon:yes gene_type:complete